MSKSWTSGKAWLDVESRGVEHEVAPGHSLKFFEVSTQRIFALRGLAGPIGKLIGVLTADTKNDVAQKTTRYKGPDEGGSDEGEVLEISAIDTRLALARAEKREQAVSDLITAVTSADNIHVVGELIMDSLRKEFPRGNTTNPSPEQFLEEVSLPMLAQMIVGLVKANARVFGDDVGEKMAGLVQERMTLKLAGVSGKAEAPGQPESPSSKAPKETPGSSSQTESNGSPAEATASPGS